MASEGQQQQDSQDTQASSKASIDAAVIAKLEAAIIQDEEQKIAGSLLNGPKSDADKAQPGGTLFLLSAKAGSKAAKAAGAVDQTVSSE